MKPLILLFNYFIFPGLIFSLFLGLLAGWIDRKVTARLQWRQGPPWHQNFTDILKLLGKETILPQSAKATFLLAPFFGLLSIALVSFIINSAFLPGRSGFSADLIVVLYLLTIPAISLIIGASSSRNPLASVGGSREIKLVLAYELPFILSIITVIIKSKGAIQLDSLLGHQFVTSSNIASLSGAIAFIVAIFCSQAKLGLAPFDISEAEQEIMAGTLIEYSGMPLAVFKMMKAVLLYVMPVFLIVLFLGKDISPLFMVLKFLAILTIFILIKNTNPRLRIDQAMRFFWGPLAGLAVIAMLLAIVGL
jgi:NADH-quinone oxidoreductase subunit H